MKHTTISILLFLTIGTFAGSAQSATALQGTGAETVSRIIHDNDGNILFASHHGVYRYDGRVVVPLLTDNMSISDIAYIGNDTLFFAANKGFGGMIDIKGDISYFGNREKKATERVLPLPNNRVVLTTDDGLVLYDCTDKKQLSTFIQPISPTSSTNNVHLEYDSDKGVIWFVTPDFIIQLDQNLTERSYAVFDDDTDPSTIFFDRAKQQLLIGTNNGLYNISYDMVLTKEDFLSGQHILFVVKDDRDSIIVGAADSGIFIYNAPEHPQILPDVRLHTDNCICHVFKGCIWLAINGMGVVYYPYHSGPLVEVEEKFLHKQIVQNYSS